MSLLEVGQDMDATLHAVDVLARVQRRLEAAGADQELHHFHRMSSWELERLVWLEAQGCTSIPPHTPRASVVA